MTMRTTVTRLFRGTGVTMLAAIAVGVTMGTSVLVAPTAGASSWAAATVTVVGRASITGAPSGWTSVGVRVQLCPATEKFVPGCSGQVVGDPKGSTRQYKVAVTPGAWRIGLYYYTDYGQIVSGPSAAIHPTPGTTTTHRNLQMAYVVPAARGTVTVTGKPTHFDSETYMGVQACPGAKFSWECKGSTEAYENIHPGSAYSIDLSAGVWTMAAYYHPDSNNGVFTGSPVTVVAVHGLTAVKHLSIKYQGLKP
jgi:hypothetical protein